MSKLSKKTKLAIIGTILYILMPLDLIPDYIVGFGQVDDLLVFSYTLKLLLEDIKVKRKQKQKRERKLVN